MNVPNPGGMVKVDTQPNRTGRMLTEEQLSALAKSFPAPYSVRETTTEIEAGYMLGVAAVMQRLREGV